MEWNPRFYVVALETSDLVRRGASRPRLGAIGTHTQGPSGPGLPALSSSRTSLRAALLLFHSPYTLQTPV